jgi:DnaJ family protein A protein 2
MPHIELYNTLEVSPNASMDEIKKAYRKLAIKYHPDRNPDKKEECTKKTQELNFAYEILSNEEKRNNYDKHGLEEPQNKFNGMNPFDIFPFNRTPKQDNKEELTLKINLKKIYHGKEKNIQITQKCKCPSCNASIKKCDECNGQGIKIILQRMGPMISQCQIPCEKCNQTGKIVKSQKCNDCSNGIINKNIDYKLVIQKNQDYKKHIKLEGYGSYNFETNKHNDLYINFEIKDDLFEINNYDIIYKLDINIQQALTGENIFITHPNDKIYKIQINEIIKDNDIKMIKNLGLPSSYGYGDFIIRFKYIYPSKILTLEDFNSFININNKSEHENYNIEYLTNIDNDDKDEEKQHMNMPPQCTPS